MLHVTPLEQSTINHFVTVLHPDVETVNKDEKNSEENEDFDAAENITEHNLKNYDSFDEEYKDEKDSRYEESLKNDNEEVCENIMESIDERKHGCEQCGECMETEKKLNGHIERDHEIECSHRSVVILEDNIESHNEDECEQGNRNLLDINDDKVEEKVEHDTLNPY